jgi:hypothetical protein
MSNIIVKYGIFQLKIWIYVLFRLTIFKGKNGVVALRVQFPNKTSKRNKARDLQISVDVQWV